ncbi:MAG: NUDIX hydrolase [Actinomycetota bacterium]|nr:NUDIX hydrolase [Actinomycetota bacterium]
MVLRRAGKLLMLRRSMTMPFARGMFVFPGGGLAQVDRQSADPWRACAIRETFEEVEIEVSDCVLFDRWITPEIEDRRYDVAFFLADVDTDGRLVTTEADEMVWLSPMAALEQHRAGLLPLLRPTLVVLEDLAAHRVATSANSVVPKLPRRRPDGRWDVIDASSGRVLMTVEDGPTTTETEGVGDVT